MTDYFKQLFKQYQPKGILVDTNILLLLFVGTVNRDRISRFNRTEKFTPEDFDTLETILKTFRTRVTTPNILTEVNSFINQIGEPERSQCLNLFARNISGFNEQYLESQQVAKNPKFALIGLNRLWYHRISSPTIFSLDR